MNLFADVPTDRFDMDCLEIIGLIVIGFIAGAVNTLAGGGSLLTLPILIFLGLPSIEANASNRVAIFLQNVFTVAGFKSKGVSEFPLGLWLSIPAVLGSFIGAYFSIGIRDETFNKILSVIMIMIMMNILFKKKLTGGIGNWLGKKRKWSGIFFFFLIGIYGGFIQAGVGFIIIYMLLQFYSHFNLAKINSIKVFVILCFTFSSLILFIYEDKVRWDYGLLLSLGTILGGWFTSRWSVNKDDKWIKGFLLVMTLIFSIKLWVYS